MLRSDLQIRRHLETILTTLLINNLSIIFFNMTPYFQTAVINKHIHDKMSPQMAADMNSKKVLKVSKLN